MLLFVFVFRESCGRSSVVCDASMFCHTCKNKETHPLLMDRSENQDWLLNSCDCAKQAGNTLLLLFACVEKWAMRSEYDRVFHFSAGS